MISERIDMSVLNWDKVSGLIPAIIQDSVTQQVLMLGYMNQEALQQTLETGHVTFYSRTKKRLWVKGETSGHRLTLVSTQPDCDNDALLIAVKPKGPSCHLNNRSCFEKSDAPGLGILTTLEIILDQRYRDRPKNSYSAKLFEEGVNRIAQKVGEEGVEVALAGVVGSQEDLKNEAADLIFHLLILLKEREVGLMDICYELNRRLTPDS